MFDRVDALNFLVKLDDCVDKFFVFRRKYFKKRRNRGASFDEPLQKEVDQEEVHEVVEVEKLENVLSCLYDPRHRKGVLYTQKGGEDVQSGENGGVVSGPFGEPFERVVSVGKRNQQVGQVGAS